MENKRKAFIAGRSYGKSHILELMEIAAGINVVVQGNMLSVEQWLVMEPTDEDIAKFPNAKKAAELKKTKLYKALK